MQRILVWDVPTRVFHWALVLCFAGAWLTADSEYYRRLHVALGYAATGLVAFRLLWGFAGTRYARFGDFVGSPIRALGYLRSLLRGQPEHHVGHNPAGGLAIVVLLGLIAATTAAGYVTYNELAGEWIEEAHEALATLTLGLVGIHIVAVLLSSVAHRENLVGAMLTGRKWGEESSGIRRGYAVLGALLAAVAIVFVVRNGILPAPVVEASAGATQNEIRVSSRDEDD
jgi:cytochrome b